MNTSKIEVEAKFIIPDSATFAALQELRHLDGFELKPSGTKPVVDCYLDTAGRHLYRAGFACRLRSVKDKQIITLKSLAEAAAEIHRRQEIEEEIETRDFQAGQPLKWPENDAKKVVVEIVGSALLQPLFTLYQTRYQYQVLWRRQAVIEFSLDEVSLRNPAQVDYYELEAELLEPGSETDLTRFTAALRAVWPLQVETRSKFERALAETT